MTWDLSDRAVLVTGGSGGVGRALVEALAKAGAAVAVQYRSNAGAAEEAVQAAEDRGARAVAVRADVADRDQAHRLVEEAEAGLDADGLDGAVLLAGYPFDRDLWFADPAGLDAGDVKGPLRVDLLGSLWVCQALLPRMADRGRGSVVLTASTPALQGAREGLAYTVAKAGVVALARSLALTYAGAGVRVNAVAFGSIKTGPMEALTPAEEEPLVEETVLKRLGTPREAAEACLFLVSDEASYVTGETLVVDGGVVFR